MATLNSNEALQSLINAGSDMMSNLFYVDFSGGVFDGQDSQKQALKIRVTDISLPQATHPTNPINYMTVSLDVPKAEIELSKNISFSFRVDDNYELYKLLLKQQSITSMPNLGYAGTSIGKNDEEGFTLSVYAPKEAMSSSSEEYPDTTTNYQKIYTFKHCWISKISGLSYSYSNSSPLTAKVDLYFYDYEEPMNTIL